MEQFIVVFPSKINKETPIFNIRTCDNSFQEM